MATTIPITSDTDYNAEKLITALIAKHRAEIDRIIELKSEEQEQEIKKYGLNPQAIKDYYKDFQIENAKLRRETAHVDNTAVKAGWATLLATFASIGLVNPKHFGGKQSLLNPKEISGGRFMKWAIATVTSIVAGFTGNYAATAAFGKNMQERSTTLVRNARSALERELAMAIENTEQNVKGELPVTLPVSETSAQAKAEIGLANVLRKNIIGPRETFMAEAAKEKAAAQAATAHVG